MGRAVASLGCILLAWIDMFGTPTAGHGCAPAGDGIVHCPLR
jgi:hypothetical protein